MQTLIQIMQPYKSTTNRITKLFPINIHILDCYFPHIFYRCYYSCNITHQTENFCPSHENAHQTKLFFSIQICIISLKVQKQYTYDGIKFAQKIEKRTYFLCSVTCPVKKSSRLWHDFMMTMIKHQLYIPRL